MGTASPHEYQVGTGAVFFYSLLFHAVLILVAIVGLPHVKKEFEAPQPISVEIATIEDIIKTKEPPKEEPIQKKEEKPVETPKQALTQPKKEPIKKEPPKEEAKPKEEKPVEKKITPPPPKESVLKKPDIKKKPEPPKKEEAKKEEEFSNLMSAVLKNLAPEEEASTKPKNSQQGEVSQSITADELSAVRQQLTNCWNLLPGARDADKLAVEIRIKVRRDRTVKSVDIVDMSRYRVDPFFRAAADNAVRAVHNPSCSPLNLPPNKYDLWKDIIFNFDPRGMF